MIILTIVVNIVVVKTGGVNLIHDSG